MVLHSGDAVGPASTVAGSEIVTAGLGGLDGYIHLVATGPLGFGADVWRRNHDPLSARTAPRDSRWPLTIAEPLWGQGDWGAGQDKKK